MEFSHCYNAYYRQSAEALRRKMQGFWTFLSKNLALEQSQYASKAVAFMNFGFVHYALK